jgi:hypothetical protein
MNFPGEITVPSNFIFSKCATATMIIECLTYFQMKCGIFSFGELQCFSFNEHFIMELIPHLMCQLLLVFGHLNLFLVCEYALQSLCF